MGRIVAQIVAEFCCRVPFSLKSRRITLVGMKNANHLLLFAYMLTGLFICLTHLMTALNALNNIDIILTPHCQRILRPHAGHFAPAQNVYALP